MKKILAAVTIGLALGGGLYLYNTIWFQAFFLADQFYRDIFHAPFDVTVKGESISIPIKFHSKTCYALSIAVHDSSLFHTLFNSEEVGNGTLTYRFVSQKNILAKGTVGIKTERRLNLKNGVTSIKALVFDLPFPGMDKDLTLELEVIEPLSFLKRYSGNIFCRINPNYNPKFNTCYNEALRITP